MKLIKIKDITSSLYNYKLAISLVPFIKVRYSFSYPRKIDLHPIHLILLTLYNPIHLVLHLHIQLHPLRHHKQNLFPLFPAFLIDFLNFLCKFQLKKIRIFSQRRLEKDNQQRKQEPQSTNKSWVVTARFVQLKQGCFEIGHLEQNQKQHEDQGDDDFNRVHFEHGDHGVNILSGLFAKQDGIDFAQVEQDFRVDVFLFALIALKLARKFIILHDKEFEFFLSKSVLKLKLFGHSSFADPVIDSLDLGQFFATQLNEFLGLLVWRVNAGAAVGDVDENVFGKGVIFLFESSKSVEQKIVGLLFDLVKVLVFLLFRHVHQLLRVKFERDEIVIIAGRWQFCKSRVIGLWLCSHDVYLIVQKLLLFGYSEFYFLFSILQLIIKQSSSFIHFNHQFSTF